MTDTLVVNKHPMVTRLLSQVSTSSIGSNESFDQESIQSFTESSLSPRSPRSTHSTHSTHSPQPEPNLSQLSKPSLELKGLKGSQTYKHSELTRDTLSKHVIRPTLRTGSIAESSKSIGSNKSNKSNNILRQSNNRPMSAKSNKSNKSSRSTSTSTFRKRGSTNGNKFVQLQRQSTLSPEKTIKSLGIVSNTNDYFLKCLLWIPFGIFMAFITLFKDKNHLPKYFAYTLCYIGICSVGMVAIPSFKAKKLRAFETQHCRFKDFANISIPYGIKEYPHEPVRSVSQLLAVRGTLWHGKISEASLITFIFVTMALIDKGDSFVNKLDGNNGIYASICAFLGGFGAWTVSSWELDMKDPISYSLHYFGVTLAFIGSFALVIEQNFSIFSISWIIVAFIALVYWTYISKFWVDGLKYIFPTIKLHRFENLNANDIHKISFHALAAEICALFCALMSLVCFVYQLDKY